MIVALLGTESIVSATQKQPPLSRNSALQTTNIRAERGWKNSVLMCDKEGKR